MPARHGRPSPSPDGPITALEPSGSGCSPSALSGGLHYLRHPPIAGEFAVTVRDLAPEQDRQVPDRRGASLGSGRDAACHAGGQGVADGGATDDFRGRSLSHAMTNRSVGMFSLFTGAVQSEAKAISSRYSDSTIPSRKVRHDLRTPVTPSTIPSHESPSGCTTAG